MDCWLIKLRTIAAKLSIFRLVPVSGEVPDEEVSKMELPGKPEINSVNNKPEEMFVQTRKKLPYRYNQ